MRAAHRLRDYVVGGLVSVETVNALLVFGEPMLTDYRGVPGYEGYPPFRAWMRRHGGGRVMGRPDLSPQFAATALLEKLRGER